jgi:hypothetical protein
LGFEPVIEDQMPKAARAPSRTSPRPPNSIDPDALFSREALSAALAECGISFVPETLATLACRGGGPVYRKLGNVAIYRWGGMWLPGSNAS